MCNNVPTVPKEMGQSLESLTLYDGLKFVLTHHFEHITISLALLETSVTEGYVGQMPGGVN